MGTKMNHAYSLTSLQADSFVRDGSLELSGDPTEGNTTDGFDTNGPLDLSNTGDISLIDALPLAPFAVGVQ